MNKKVERLEANAESRKGAHHPGTHFVEFTTDTKRRRDLALKKFAEASKKIASGRKSSSKKKSSRKR